MLWNKYINSMVHFRQSLVLICCSIQITDSCTLITDLNIRMRKIYRNVLSLWQKINNKALWMK